MVIGIILFDIALVFSAMFVTLCWKDVTTVDLDATQISVQTDNKALSCSSCTNILDPQERLSRTQEEHNRVYCYFFLSPTGNTGTNIPNVSYLLSERVFFRRISWNEFHSKLDEMNNTATWTFMGATQAQWPTWQPV